VTIPLFLYNTGLFLYGAALRIASLFHTKARLFVRGRKDIFDKIEQSLAGDTRKKIWVHCASLGEFEQGRPVIEQIREQYPDKTILLTFFSPSGYEVKKDYKYADHIFYLPLDSKRNAERMIGLVQPELVLFVKYEFWYHYLKTLYTKHIPVVLFSAIFQQRHPFFKWYGGLYRKMLGYYSQIFVQDQESALLLNSIKVTGVQVAGDTRFDRAAKVRENNSAFPSIEAFKGTHNLVIAGSTWPEDEKLLQQAFEQLPPDYKLLIAPHETHTAHIEQIQALFPGQYCLWDAQEELLREKRVCIVNTVGYLSYLYGMRISYG
jgi:3-deoxy-D-manno-octulosonic-acid transferase